MPRESFRATSKHLVVARPVDDESTRFYGVLDQLQYRLDGVRNPNVKSGVRLRNRTQFRPGLVIAGSKEVGTAPDADARLDGILGREALRDEVELCFDKATLRVEERRNLGQSNVYLALIPDAESQEDLVEQRRELGNELGATFFDKFEWTLPLGFVGNESPDAIGFLEGMQKALHATVNVDPMWVVLGAACRLSEI